MDKRILLYLIERHGGGPVGVNAIAAAIGEDPGTIEEGYEPFLIQEGLLKRTPQGRVATEGCYTRFGVKPPSGQGTLL